MDKLLRPERFDCDPNASTASSEWNHWKTTFDNFIATYDTQEINKLHTLINLISPKVYNYIIGLTYDNAIKKLSDIYLKPKNTIHSRHLLATRMQKMDEDIDTYLQNLRLLARDCNYQDVTADIYTDESILISFISGLSSNSIRQRLLENKSLNLEDAISQARALESAQKDCQFYSNSNHSFNNINIESNPIQSNKQNSNCSHITENNYNCEDKNRNDSTLASTSTQKCWFCGKSRHSRDKCPAKNAICGSCGKRGHFKSVCKSRQTNCDSSISTLNTLLASSSSAIQNKAVVSIKINGNEISKALIDSGSHESYISQKLATCLKLECFPTPERHISLASSSMKILTNRQVNVNIQLINKKYPSVKLNILKDLCYDIILGQDFLCKHKSVHINYGGDLEPLSICLMRSQLEASNLFSLTNDCKPIAMPTRKFNSVDRQFISSEVRRLLSEGIIERSYSSWRAQPQVTTDDRHKRRLVIDYSQTINRFTIRDAFPLPNMETLIEDVSKYKVFSQLDLKSAYHQVALNESDKMYTAFEADGCLYQFTRLPFGVTNGVACFQRLMNSLIREHDLKGVFCYIDDIIVCGTTENEHNESLRRLLDIFSTKGITLNKEKCKFNQHSIRFLGYHVSDGNIKPDEERLKPLKELPIPEDTASLKRAIGLFSYYSSWINKFSEKLCPLLQADHFPLTNDAISAFNEIKREIEASCRSTVDPNLPIIVETDASDFAISATLNQSGRPIAFFSRTLNNNEKNYAAVEKEAHAIIEALRKWRHYLLGKHFTLLTDQKSVSYMLDYKNHGKIKNDKITRWRIELAPYNFDIVYRPGSENKPADALSRICSINRESRDTKPSLQKLHEDLAHPGIKKMNHFIKIKNLPFSIEDIRKVNSTCRICAEFKPQFVHTKTVPLIKATQPFERLNVDFKGPLPKSNNKTYLLVIIDEYSRFPFAYPCSNISAQTVINCLSDLFSIFGMPSYVHSDRGSQFMSEEVRQFLNSKGIAMSRTCPYNPTGNGQCEKYNDIIWRNIKMQLKTNRMSDCLWTNVLSNVLHSLRSLLCTSTNETPHERMFKYSRKSSSGNSIPSFLTNPCKVYLKNFVRTSKQDPLVQEVDLIQANPTYAYVRYPDGRESTVSIKHLARCPKTVSKEETSEDVNDVDMTNTNENNTNEEVSDVTNDTNIERIEPLRKSTRTTRMPERYGFE